MSDWKLLAIATPLLFATYQTLSKILPKDTSVFLVNAYASLIGFVIMLVLHLLFSSNKSLLLNPKSFSIAMGIGLLIAFGNFGIIKAYTVGAPQSIFTPLFYVILITYGILFGILFWHEKLNPLQLFGIALSIIGLFVIMYSRR